MDEMATNTEYILRMVLELIDKCKTLDELREAVKAVLDEAKYKEGSGPRSRKTATQPQRGRPGALPWPASIIAE